MYLLAEIQVCYGKYGCFSTGKPFNRIVLLPFPPALIAPTYRLYTRLNPDKPQFIDDSDVHKLKNSRYSGSKRTVIVVHGYIGKLKNNSTYTSKEVIETLSYYRLYCHYVLIITHPESEVWVKSEVEPASQRLLSLRIFSRSIYTLEPKPGIFQLWIPENFRSLTVIFNQPVSKNNELYTPKTSCLEGTSAYIKNISKTKQPLSSRKAYNIAIVFRVRTLFETFEAPDLSFWTERYIDHHLPRIRCLLAQGWA